jgi:hypothetical protein
MRVSRRSRRRSRRSRRRRRRRRTSTSRKLESHVVITGGGEESREKGLGKQK